MSHAGGGNPPLAWLIWYGLKIGLSYTETLDLPVGELKTLIAIEQIKCEGLDEKLPENGLGEFLPDLA